MKDSRVREVGVLCCAVITISSIFAQPGSGTDDKTCERLRPLSPEAAIRAPSARWLTRGIGDDKNTTVRFNGIE